jgi:hypothetical protein
VSGGVGRHLLEPRAGAALTLAASLRRRPRSVEPLDQVVADLLELGHVRDVALRAKQWMGGLARLAGVAGVGGQLRLETGDLAAELLPADALVGDDLGQVRLRRRELLAGLARGGAGRVDRPRQVARIDAVLAGVLDRLGGEALEIR